MQIRAKKGIAVITATLLIMMLAIGISFAVSWDSDKAEFAGVGNMEQYANAEVGDEIVFGRYWQKASPTYEDKDPITWIVVDKNEITGELTLWSKAVLARGSYFGTEYRNAAGTLRNTEAKFLSNYLYNQSWRDSTARAYLNNLERWDMGGDKFVADIGIDNVNRIAVPYSGDLLASVGYSNARHYTGLTTEIAPNLLADYPNMYFQAKNLTGQNTIAIQYQRPKATNTADRLPLNGFLDEAFTPEERKMIVPRQLPGETCYRRPYDADNIVLEYIDGTKDAVWIPSYAELGIDGTDSAFELFKNYQKYGYADQASVLQAPLTEFMKQPPAITSHSIPSYLNGNIWADVSSSAIQAYWTRTPRITNIDTLFTVRIEGIPNGGGSCTVESFGLRPAIILKY